MSRARARFINRELSWLEFNQRVLNEARDEKIPLAERLNFLAITASNLDEFFMVRVGGLQQLAAQGRKTVDPAGITVEDQLAAIRERISSMTADQYACYLNELQPQLAEAGIVRLASAQLTTRQSTAAEEVFTEQVFPVLSPIAVRSAEDFPLLANRTLNVCAQLRPPADAPDAPRFAVIPLGEPLSRIVTLPTDGGYGFMLLEDLVAMFVDRFFPGVEVLECVPFRLTRNADLSVREDQAHDLLAEMEEVLDARKASRCVRLEVSQSITTASFRFLTESLDLAPE
jgi:polyphosphate kinase